MKFLLFFLFLFLSFDNFASSGELMNANIWSVLSPKNGICGSRQLLIGQTHNADTDTYPYKQYSTIEYIQDPLVVQNGVFIDAKRTLRVQLFGENIVIVPRKNGDDSPNIKIYNDSLDTEITDQFVISNVSSSSDYATQYLEILGDPSASSTTVRTGISTSGDNIITTYYSGSNLAKSRTYLEMFSRQILDKAEAEMKDFPYMSPKHTSPGFIFKNSSHKVFKCASSGKGDSFQCQNENVIFDDGEANKKTKWQIKRDDEIYEDIMRKRNFINFNIEKKLDYTSRNEPKGGSIILEFHNIAEDGPFCKYYTMVDKDEAGAGSIQNYDFQSCLRPHINVQIKMPADYIKKDYFNSNDDKEKPIRREIDVSKSMDTFAVYEMSYIDINPSDRFSRYGDYNRKDFTFIEFFPRKDAFFLKKKCVNSNGEVFKTTLLGAEQFFGDVSVEINGNTKEEVSRSCAQGNKYCIKSIHDHFNPDNNNPPEHGASEEDIFYSSLYGLFSNRSVLHKLDGFSMSQWSFSAFETGKGFIWEAAIRSLPLNQNVDRQQTAKTPFYRYVYFRDNDKATFHISSWRKELYDKHLTGLMIESQYGGGNVIFTYKKIDQRIEDDFSKDYVDDRIKYDGLSIHLDDCSPRIFYCGAGIPWTKNKDVEEKVDQLSEDLRKDIEKQATQDKEQSNAAREAAESIRQKKAIISGEINGIADLLCRAHNVLTGEVGKAIVGFIVVVTGISMFMGKVSMGLMITIIIGTTIFFGGPSILLYFYKGQNGCGYKTIIVPDSEDPYDRSKDKTFNLNEKATRREAEKILRQ